MSTAGTDGVYVVPAFVGLGAPYWDQDARGTISGITRGTNLDHIIRATVESLAYQSKDLLVAMQKEANINLTKLKVDGGACANNFLMQFQADILGIDIVRPKIIETTALGAAYLAGLSSNFWKDINEIKNHWQESARFHPRLAPDKVNKLYQGWQKAVRKTLSK